MTGCQWGGSEAVLLSRAGTFVTYLQVQSRTDQIGFAVEPSSLLLGSQWWATHQEFPQASHVIASLEAGRLQPLLQTAPYGGQTTDASSDDSYSLPHGLLEQGLDRASSEDCSWMRWLFSRYNQPRFKSQDPHLNRRTQRHINSWYSFFFFFYHFCK